MDDLIQRQCPECGGWELGDGSEDADFNPCVCDEEDDDFEVSDMD